jgi:hypothetical protein
MTTLLTAIFEAFPQTTRSYCDQEATLFEYLVATNIKALTATKRNPNPDTQLRLGLGSLLPHLGF